jgi:hypothetical protein
MKRDDALAAGLMAGAAPLSAIAQSTAAPQRIGFLGFGAPELDTALWLISFRGGMLELGWVEGRD